MISESSCSLDSSSDDDSVSEISKVLVSLVFSVRLLAFLMEDFLFSGFWPSSSDTIED